MQPLSGHHVFCLLRESLMLPGLMNYTKGTLLCQPAWAEPEIVTIRWTQKKAGSFIFGGNMAFAITMLNWSRLSADNEHTLFCWLMTPADTDIFNWDLFYLRLFCIWMAHTANLKIGTAKTYQTTESDGKTDLWNQKCSLNKDWEQLSTTVASEVP